MSREAAAETRVATIESVPSQRQYESLLDAAETYRAAIVIRLCGEVGLRPAEVSRLTVDAVEQVQTDPPRYLLCVPTGDDRPDRTAYLPTRVERELRRYVRSNDREGDDRIFPVTPRRLQMLVASVADRASDRVGDDELAAVSTSDLRQYFARRALVDCEINPRAVKTAGGWGSFEALEPYLAEPTAEELVMAFAPLEGDRAAHDEPGQLSVVACSYRALTEAILSATSHDEVETATCTTLVDAGAYDCAWIDRRTLAEGRREWRTSSGIDPGAIDRLVPEEWSTASVADDEIQLVDDVTVSTEDGDPFEGQLARVSLSSGGTIYGTLTVATSRADAFDDDECDWLTTIGRQVGYAIAAVRRRNLLLSDRVLDVEFRCRDERSFFVETSQELACRFELESLVPVSESTQLYYIRLEGATPSAVFDRAAADPGIDSCRLIETDEDGWQVEFVVSGSAPTLTLTEYGVTALTATIEDGVATITGECAADADLRAIVAGLRSAFPASKLVGKRETERAVQTAREFREGLGDRLTDRQEASLRAAYFGGYYDWPRESTAEEVADAMDISSPTLHNHLRKGQHELLRTFFDGATE